jgi:hypothetical protein
VKSPGFAVHHELLGTGEGDAPLDFGVVYSVADKCRHLGLANGKSGWKPLTELAVFSIWHVEEEGIVAVRVLSCMRACRALLWSHHFVLAGDESFPWVFGNLFCRFLTSSPRAG